MSQQLYNSAVLLFTGKLSARHIPGTESHTPQPILGEEDLYFAGKRYVDTVNKMPTLSRRSNLHSIALFVRDLSPSDRILFSE
jgi:hypothetical protein